MTPVQRLAGLLILVLALVVGAAGVTWKVQDWRYGEKLAQMARSHTDTLNQLAMAGASAQKTEQDKRLALEQQLSISEQTHYKELSDAKRDQDRLRDRLATSDLRLSVLLDTTVPASCNAVPASASAGGVVHGARRAQLDPSHAQRIIGITDEGDRGLIALAACQAYVRGLNQ